MDQVQYQVANEQLGSPRLFVKVLFVEHQWKPTTYPLDHKALTIVERPETGPYYLCLVIGNEACPGCSIYDIDDLPIAAL